MSHRENITRIKAVHYALEELAKDVVFVGGATVSLYSTRPETKTRATDDVDIVIEILHYRDYAAIEEKLRSKGFMNDVQSGIICRYIIHGITVDIMPTSENVLGFKNKWYPEAYAHAMSINLERAYLSEFLPLPISWLQSWTPLLTGVRMKEGLVPTLRILFTYCIIVGPFGKK